MRCILLYYLFPRAVYSSLLVEVEHCQNWFSNFPANGTRCILLYIICFLMQFIQFAGGGLTLPKLVFAEIFPLIA